MLQYTSQFSKEAEVDEGINTIANARVTSNCKVNWRNVWGGAVLGGVGNGIRGAIIGGTGRTVALPGVGTVTGAVSGAVFGFAQGFVGGAAYGVAQELLLSCFRSTQSQDTYCRQFFERWERGEIPAEHIPSQCWPEIDFSDFTLSSF